LNQHNEQSCAPQAQPPIIVDEQVSDRPLTFAQKLDAAVGTKEFQSPNVYYRNLAEALRDRTQLETFAEALQVSRRNINKNECDQWVIAGKGNRIETSEDPTCFMLYVCCESVRRWSAIKQKAKSLGLDVIVDCDGEGFISLSLPDERQAAFLRKLLGLRRKRTEGRSEQ
jgi:hypothetical protein